MADLFQKAEVVVTKVTIEEQSDSKMEIVDITSEANSDLEMKIMDTTIKGHRGGAHGQRDRTREDENGHEVVEAPFIMV